MKTITIKSSSEISAHIDRVRRSAEATRLRLLELTTESVGLELLSQMKYEQIGCDPLDLTRALNVVEQINQTLTYLATFRAAEILFTKHSEMSQLTMNLGTAPGFDLESPDAGGIAAEVFAATHPASNRKLSKDIKRVRGVSAAHKYVFFACPGISARPYDYRSSGDVHVWSLGTNFE